MGESYNPVAYLGCENTTALMRYIWQHRQQASLTLLSSAKQLPQYKALKQNTFSAAAAGIVDREVFNMIADAKAFNDPPYEVYNKAAQGAEADMRVGYKRLDGMSDFVYGELFMIQNVLFIYDQRSNCWCFRVQNCIRLALRS
jgi:hypothetical protein